MGDSAATRERILAAATVEFADHGIAGARVDRIAARAQANKSLIYSYFGNKDELFDVVFTSSVDSDVGRTPFDADDLPGYAARYYDMYLGDPHLVRLLTWARLERTPHGALFADVPDHDVDVLADIADAQRRRVVVDDIEPADLWSMLIAMAATWAQSAIVHTATESEDPALPRLRRTALATAVSRAFCVPTH